MGMLLLLVVGMFAQSASTSQSQVDQRVESILSKMTLEQKIDMIGGVDGFYIRGYKDLGIPRLKMSDGPLGVRNYGPATTFPAGISMAASFDPELVKRVGTIIGQDARARGVHFLLGPGVNIHRAPMCGRNFEYYGEDPFLASRTVVGYITGIQSQGVIATVKHFFANNQEYNRHNISSDMDERTAREIYLPTFEAAVKEAHVGAIMDSYNLVNGVHMTQNGLFNTQIAKKEWGFTGIIMSDWDATYDGVAAANGGLDLEMPSGKFMNRQNLLPAVQQGKVSVATIDDKIRRILRTAIQFGFLDRDQTDPNIPLFNQEGRKVALEAAKAGMVLLKNDGNLLPLDKNKIKTIAIIGPDAYPAVPIGGGSAGVRPFVEVSYMEGLTNYLGSNARVLYHRGLPTLGEMAMGTEFSTDSNGGEHGLKAEFFKGTTLEGSPATTRTDQHVNFERGLGSGVPSYPLSARWTGYFTPKHAGQHTVFVAGTNENGGSRLYIDDKLVVDNWTRVTALVNQATLSLDATPHKVRLEFFSTGGWGVNRIVMGIIAPDDVVAPEAKELASHADAVILAPGFDPQSESEGGDRTFQLPPGQDALIQALLNANKNTVVVLTAGGNVDMTQWIDHTPALVHAWYAGQEGGTALAQLLFGEFSPSGRLPVTFERRWEDNAVYNSYYPQDDEKKVAYKEGIFVGYRYFEKNGKKPLFPFGYGLSYTTFAYSNLSVTPGTVRDAGTVTVSFDVKNTGNREGAEVAQVYVGDHHASVPRPVKELKGFSKVYLQPGESKKVSVTLNRRSFSYFDPTAKEWKAAPGEFDILVGRSSAEIELQGKVILQH